jgi:hypothetical protein
LCNDFARVRGRKEAAPFRKSWLVVATLAAVCACADAPGSFTVHFSWVKGESPASLPHPLFLYGFVDATPGSTVHTAVSGPNPYTPGGSLSFGNVPNGTGLVLTVELLDSPGQAAQVIAYGKSAPFDLQAGKHITVDVALELHTVTAIPASGGVQINGETDGEVRTPTVDLELFADATAVGARISNLPALPAGSGTVTVSALTPDPATVAPDGFRAFRYTGWNLDEGLPAACAAGMLCQRSVYVFFTDQNGIPSETSNTAVTLNRENPGLSVIVSPLPPVAAGLGTTVILATTPSEPLTKAPVPHVFKTSDTGGMSEVGGFFGAPLAGTQYTFEHQVSLSDAQTTYYVTFDLVDIAGNSDAIGADQSYQFAIDTTAPAIQSLTIAGGSSTRFSRQPGFDTLNVSFTTTKPLASCQAGIDGNLSPCVPSATVANGYTWTYQETGQDPEGNFPLNIVAYDAAGNVAQPPNPPPVITLDYTPPSLVASSTRASRFNVGVGQTETLTLTPSEALGAPPTLALSGPGTLAFSNPISENGTSYTSTYVVQQGDQSGAYASTIQMVDVVGNATPVALTGPAFNLDTVVPVITNVKTDAGAYSEVAGHNLVTLTFNCPKSVDTGLQVTLSGRAMSCQPWVAATAPQPSYTCTYQLTLPTDTAGPQTIAITATDEAENTASGWATVTFDFTAPVLTPSAAPNPANASSLPTLSVAVSKSLAGAPTVTVVPGMGATGSIAVGTARGGGSNWTFPLVPSAASGSFGFSVQGTDAVGHAGSASTSLMVDTVPPVLDHVATNASIYSEVAGYNQVSVTFDSSEPLETPPAALHVIVGQTRMQCGTYQATSPSYTCSYTVTGAEGAGTKAITISALDAAGNGSSTGTSVTFDFSPPVVTPVVAPNPANALSSPVLTVASSKSLPSSPVLTITPIHGTGGSLSAGAVAGGGTSWSFPLNPASAQGSFSIAASATDAIGHVGSGSTTLIIDVVTPVITQIETNAETFSEVSPYNQVQVSFHTSKPASVSAFIGGLAMTCLQPQVGITTYSCSYTTSANGSEGSGTKVIAITASDAAGNTAQGSTSVSFDFSTPALTPTVAPNPANAASAPQLSVSSTKPLTGLSVTSIAPVDSATGTVTPGTVTGSATFWSVPLSVGGANGVFAVTAQGEDDLGHVASGTAELTVDTLVPAITNVTTNGTTFSEVTPFNVVEVMFDTPKPATVTAAVGGINMSCGTWQSSSPRYTCSSRALQTTDGLGTQVISLTALDEAGNSSQATASVVFDFSPLVLNVVASPNPAGAAATTPELSVTAGKPLAGAPSVAIVPQGLSQGELTTGTATGSGTSWQVPILQAHSPVAGNFQISAFGVDEVGHTQTASTAFVMNSTSPVIGGLTLNAVRYSAQPSFRNVQLTFNYSDDLDTGAAALAATIGGYLATGAPMTMSCSAYQNTQPNYTCTYTAVGTELSTDGQTAISSLAQVDLPITIVATDTVGNQGFGSTSATFDFMPPALSTSSSPAIQYIPAPNQFTTGTPAACLSRQNLLTSVSAATTCTDIRVSFTMTEPLFGNPLVTAANGAITFAASTAADLSYVYDGTTTTAGSPPDNVSYRLTISATDLVGNGATLTPATPTFSLQTRQPAAPANAPAGAISYVRIPWGNSATGGVPQFSVIGSAGAATGAGTVIAYGSALGPGGTPGELGRGLVDGSGAFDLTLTEADHAQVFLAAVDPAGNSSSIVPVQNMLWKATYGGKTPGNLFVNPHLLLTSTDFAFATASGTPGYLFGPVLQSSAFSSEATSYTGVTGASDGSTLAVTASSLWVQRPVSANPGPRTQFGMTYDSRRGVTVIFGGDGYSELASDVWEWNGMAWTNTTPNQTPAARTGPALAYDAAQGVSILFGGAAGGTESTATTFNDTWSWDGSVFTQLSPVGTLPAGRFAHAMAYDSNRGVVVLFGGTTPQEALFGDTWEWQGSSWKNVSPLGSYPPARYGHQMVFDVVDGVTVLFGGSTPETLLNDLWTWNGSSWKQASPSGPVPQARTDFAMAYDVAQGLTYVAGGIGASGVLSDVWTWNGTAWTDVTEGTPAPPALSGAAMAYDSARSTLVLFSGCEGAIDLPGDCVNNGAPRVDGHLGVERDLVDTLHSERRGSPGPLCPGHGLRSRSRDQPPVRRRRREFEPPQRYLALERCVLDPEHGGTCAGTARGRGAGVRHGPPRSGPVRRVLFRTESGGHLRELHG